MQSGIFTDGTLMLPASPSSDGVQSLMWGDMLSTRMLMVLSALSILLCLNDFIRLFPFLIRSMALARVNMEIEHNVSTSRMRKWVALACSVPFCLIVDRFGLFPCRTVETLPEEWHSPAIIVIFALYLLVRHVCFLIIRPAQNQETAASVHHAMHTYFILLVVTMVAGCGLFILFDASDVTVHGVLSWLTAGFFVLGFVRTGQILSQNNSSLTTFLYLCGLELIPVGLLYVVRLVL